MDELICKEKHKNIDMQLQVHDKRLNDHARRLDELTTDSREYKIQIQDLCKDISSLVSTVRWFMGLLIGAFVSFFFYAAQRGLLK